MSKEEVKKQFGANAAAYATSTVHAKGASLARLVELVQPQQTWQVLDVASAAGHTAFAFAPFVAKVTSTDLTPEMLPVASNLAEKKGIENVLFQTADAEDLPFDDGQFDLVTCRIAPHHFPHIDRFLAESCRVLRPGGILAVVDNIVPGSNRGSDKSEAIELAETGDYVNKFEKLRDPSHRHCFSLQEWLDAYANAGFTLLAQETAEKRMVFDPWVKRMGASPETQAQVRSMLTDAPPAAATFFQIEADGADIAFYLTEAILIGQKPQQPIGEARR
jgi:ubiquinone/menaquinone biosynthesis C-methylase UbiE